jgi:hypothetical protein
LTLFPVVATFATEFATIVVVATVATVVTVVAGLTTLATFGLYITFGAGLESFHRKTILACLGVDFEQLNSEFVTLFDTRCLHAFEAVPTNL